MQVKPTAVDVRCVIHQTVCLRPNDALENHTLEHLASLSCDAGVAECSFLELGQRRQFTGLDGFFDAIWKANAIGMVEKARCLSTRQHQLVRDKVSQNSATSLQFFEFCKDKSDASRHTFIRIDVDFTRLQSHVTGMKSFTGLPFA